MNEPADAALLRLIRAHGAAQALALLGPIASASVRRRAEHLVRVERAAELLRARLPRTVIADRLCASGCSRATAYRSIEAALGRETVARRPGP